MMYLVRGLAEFPPPAVRNSARATPDAWLRSFQEQRWRDRDYKSVMSELDPVLRGSPAELQATVDRVVHEFEIAARSGRSTFLIKYVALKVADHRAPREARPLMRKAAEFLEPEAPDDGLGAFADLCRRLASWSLREEARGWFARAVVAFEQMDFGPACGAPIPHGHFPKWAETLAEWSSREEGDRAEDLFQQARGKFEESIRNTLEVMERPRRIGFSPMTAQSVLGDTIVSMVSATERRARRLARGPALSLLAEEREWIERLRPTEMAYRGVLASICLPKRPWRRNGVRSCCSRSNGRYQALLALVPAESAAIYSDWASGLGKLGLYEESIAKFEDGERIQADLAPLQMNWSSILVQLARDGGGPADLWSDARQRAERVEQLGAGRGAYNLACIAAESGDATGVAKWLQDAAGRGKMPPLWHCLEDESFRPFHTETWFRELIDDIFDAGYLARR